MKKILLITVFITIALSSFSQDYISLKKGERLKVVVTTITPNVVKYKLFNDSQGRIYFVYKEDISEILYKDGRIETFTESGNQNNSSQSSDNNDSDKNQNNNQNSSNYTVSQDQDNQLKTIPQNQNSIGDYILLKDGTRKTVTVLEITPDVVKYRDFNNSSGAIYTISKSDVTKIIFQNGNEETFTDSNFSPLELVNNKIYMDGRKLSNKEIKSLFQGTNALALYKQSKILKGTGIGVACLGSLFGGVGLGFLMSSDKNYDLVEPLMTQSESITLLITGGIAIAGGAVLTYQASNLKKKAVNIYNKSPKKKNDLSLNVGFVGNGLGIRVVF
jgi:hypothetical protein